VGQNLRNKPCLCGSGKKTKVCCGQKVSQEPQGVPQLLGFPLNELADPKCVRCYGRGYEGKTTAKTADGIVNIPRFCCCIRPKFFARSAEMANAQKQIETEGEENAVNPE
jgi:hypothetical protein